MRNGEIETKKKSKPSAEGHMERGVKCEALYGTPV